MRIIADEETLDETLLVERQGVRQKIGEIRGDQGLGALVLDLVDEFPGRIERAQMRDACANAQRGEISERMIGRVRQIKRHRVALADARLGKSGREFRDERAEHRIVEARAAIGNSGPLRSFNDRLVEKLGQGADLDRGIPTSGVGEGSDPGTRGRGAHPCRRRRPGEVGKLVPMASSISPPSRKSSRNRVALGSAIKPRVSKADIGTQCLAPAISTCPCMLFLPARRPIDVGADAPS